MNKVVPGPKYQPGRARHGLYSYLCPIATERSSNELHLVMTRLSRTSTEHDLGKA